MSSRSIVTSLVARPATLSQRPDAVTSSRKKAVSGGARLEESRRIHPVFPCNDGIFLAVAEVSPVQATTRPCLEGRCLIQPTGLSRSVVAAQILYHQAVVWQAARIGRLDGAAQFQDCRQIRLQRRDIQPLAFCPDGQECTAGSTG